MKQLEVLLAAVVYVLAPSAFAANVSVDMHLIDETGIGKSIGPIHVEDSRHGLVLAPGLTGLPPGEHGFHVHQNPSCEPEKKDGRSTPGLAAGGHFDPFDTGKHEGPTGNGHLGDLPVLWVDPDGSAKLPVIAPRLKVANLKGRALVIHAGGDNYSDDPKPLGGGGARIACGIVK